MAGVDPNALIEVINAAQAERQAAQAEINNTLAPNLMDAAEVYARIGSLGIVDAQHNTVKLTLEQFQIIVAEPVS